MKKSITLTLIVALLFTVFGARSSFVYAATIKLSKTTLKLTVGDTYTLKLSGTTKAVTWSSTDKTVATVSTKGKITAKKEGTVKITATVSGKKYTCKVSIFKNKYITKAAYDAKEVVVNKLSYVIPKSFTYKSDSQIGSFYTNDKKNNNGMFVYVAYTGTKALPYNDLKEYGYLVTQDMITEATNENAGIIYSDINEKSYKATDTQTAYITSYNYKSGQTTYNINLYFYSVDNYFIRISTIQTDTYKSSISFDKASKYLLKSVTVSK